MKIDLHTHSNHSSCGDQTVRELLDVAKDFGIEVISLTDHDTMAGLEEAISYGAEIGIVVVPGIEISASTGEDTPSIPMNSRVHVLGYNVNHRDPLLAKEYEALVPAKRHRVEQIIQLLKKKGIDLNIDELPEYTELQLIRQLIARGYCQDRAAAKKIVRTSEIYTRFPEVRFSLRKSVSLTKQIGGLPVLAHAYRGANKVAYSDVQVRELILAMKGYGLVGVETHHYFHLEDGRIGKLLRICEEEGLIPTIGSDHHSYRRTYKGIGDNQLRRRVLYADSCDFTPLIRALGVNSGSR